MLPSKAKEIFNKEKNEFFTDVANTLIENYIIKSNLVVTSHFLPTMAHSNSNTTPQRRNFPHFPQSILKII
jgi:hypothetical protein